MSFFDQVDIEREWSHIQESTIASLGLQFRLDPAVHGMGEPQAVLPALSGGCIRHECLLGLIAHGPTASSNDVHHTATAPIYP